MRTANQLPIIQEANVNFPFGSTIQNETSTQEGTPVVRELIGDILQNMYKLLALVNITPNGNEDSNLTEYQIVEAIKKLPNSTNDIERVLDLDSETWTVDLDLSILPNKYFFFARASENYNSSISYTFKGTTSLEYNFTSAGFNSSDELLIIIDQAAVRGYPIASSSAKNELAIIFSNPLAFNESSNLFYQDGGYLLSDVPSISDLQGIIKDELDDITVVVNDMFIIKDHVLCFCCIPADNNYFFRQFNLNNLSVSHSVDISGTELDNISDFNPYVYAYKTVIYITNSMNTDANDYSLTKLSYNPLDLTLTYVASLNLNNTFVKTTNAAIKSGLLYTLVSGQLNSFNLTTGAKVLLGTYPIIAGQLFGFNGEVYFGTGQVAKKWF